MPERRSSPPMAAGSGSSEQNRGRGHLWLLERSTGAQRPVTSADWDVFDFGFFPDNRVVFAGRRGATPGLFVVGAGAVVSSPTPLVAVGPADAQPGRFAGRTLARVRRARARKLATLASVAGSGREPEADECRLQQHQPRVAPGLQEPGLRHRLRARRRADRARRVAAGSVRHNCRRDVGKPSRRSDACDAPAAAARVLRAERRWRLPDLAAVWQYRELFWVLALRDIRVRYKQTLLGVAWAIVQPLCTMIVFTTISHFARIATDGVRPEVFYYGGLTAWTVFANSMTSAGNSLLGSQHLITKVYFPRVVLPIAPVVTALLDFAVAFVVLLAMMLFYGVAPPPQMRTCRCSSGWCARRRSGADCG